MTVKALTKNKLLGIKFKQKIFKNNKNNIENSIKLTFADYHYKITIYKITNIILIFSIIR